jgi:hypothetical protein
VKHLPTAKISPCFLLQLFHENGIDGNYRIFDTKEEAEIMLNRLISKGLVQEVKEAK